MRCDPSGIEQPTLLARVLSSGVVGKPYGTRGNAGSGSGPQPSATNAEPSAKTVRSKLTPATIADGFECAHWVRHNPRTVVDPVPAKEPTEESAIGDDGSIDDPAWDPNAPDSEEYRAALTKNLTLELQESHGRGRIRAFRAVMLVSFLALMAFLAYGLFNKRRQLEDAEERAPPPPSGAVYKAPKPFKTKPAHS